jgi:hypothetical protein
VRTSISRRLFITIIAVVLGISILILLANTLLLKPLYYSSIKSTMIRAMDKLSEMDYADTSTLAEQIQEITAGSAYSVVIRSADAILYSDSRELGLMPQPAGNDAAGTAGGNGSESGGPVESDGVGREWRSADEYRKPAATRE